VPITECNTRAHLSQLARYWFGGMKDIRPVKVSHQQSSLADLLETRPELMTTAEVFSELSRVEI